VGLQLTLITVQLTSFNVHITQSAMLGLGPRERAMSLIIEKRADSDDEVDTLTKGNGTIG
jgi:hypothetical protein